MRLISYGMYRRVRESSVIPKQIGNAFWGGTTTTVGQIRSERWASKVEETLLNKGNKDNEENYVETGGVLEGNAEVGVTNAKIGGGLKGTWGKRYTGASVTEGKAHNVKGAELNFAVDASLLKGEATATFKWINGEFAEMEIEAKGTASAGSDTWASRLGKVIETIGKRIKTEDEQNKDSFPEKTGNIAECAQGFSAAGGLLSGSSEGVDTKLAAPVDEDGLSSSGAGEMTLKASKSAESPWEMEISFDTAEEHSVNVGIYTQKTKKVKRMWGLKYDGENWVLI